MKGKPGQKPSAYNLVNQNVHRSIFSLALPAMMSFLFYNAYLIIDAYWIGLLGSHALAGLSACSFLVWAFYSVSDLAATGTGTLVSQGIGAKRETEARQAAGQGIILVLVLSAALVIFGFASEKWIFNLMGLEPAAASLASSYFTTLLYGLIFIFLFEILQRILYGIGDTKTPMVILIISLIINAFIDPFLIFGWVCFPQTGIAGAAWATVISQFIAAALCGLTLAVKGFIPLLLSPETHKFILHRVVMILKIGAPISVSDLLFSVIYVVLTRIISTFGTKAVAALGICHRIESTVFFTALGFHIAAATLVGQFLGSKMPEKAQKTALLINLYSICLIFLISLVFYFQALPLIAIFTDDPEVQQIGVLYLKIIALFEIGLSLEIVMEGVFTGAGYTLPPMLIYIPLTAFRIPLSWFLGHYLGLGISGVWWAIGVTTALKGLLITIVFWQGQWKKKRVLE